MAEFKRALASGSGTDGGFGFDSATLSALNDMAGSYWPMMAGVLVLMLLIMKGESHAVIPIAGGTVLLQAWQFGLFG